MYDYSISLNNDPKEFKKVCVQIENHYTEAKKKEQLVDVDGTTIQSYAIGEKKIIVYDDYDVGAVYIRSDMEIPFLS